MKEGSVLINTARGPLVDEAALCEALKTGALRAAALDVFEVEPLSLTSPLLKLDNVLTSGHVAGLDTQSYEDGFKMVAETIVVDRQRSDTQNQFLQSVDQPQLQTSRMRRCH